MFYIIHDIYIADAADYSLHAISRSPSSDLVFLQFLLRHPFLPVSPIFYSKRCNSPLLVAIELEEDAIQFKL